MSTPWGIWKRKKLILHLYEKCGFLSMFCMTGQTGQSGFKVSMRKFQGYSYLNEKGKVSMEIPVYITSSLTSKARILLNLIKFAKLQMKRC